MKDSRRLIHLFLLLSLQTPIALGLERTVTVEACNSVCGFQALLARHEEAVRNTNQRHPQWQNELFKQNQSAYQIGDSLTFFTYNYKTISYDKTVALCRYQSDKTYIFVGKKEWENEQVTEANVQAFKQAFEESTPPSSINPNAGIRAILEQTFGPAPNKSGDAHIYVLIYDIIDAGNLEAYIAGYFSPNDQGNGSYSNRKDLLYIDCNPANPGSSDVLRNVAHELQHLLHYGADRDEDLYGGTWVNEGASEYASVICGYSLRSPSKYLNNPGRSLLTFDYNDNSLIDYEKVALWTYYLGEKFGPSLIGQIVQQPENSVEGVRAALQAKGISLSFEEIFSNFVVANYLNNPSLDAQGYFGYRTITLPPFAPSGDFGSYPIDHQTKTLAAYSSQYIRFYGQDSTAILTLTSLRPADTRALILQMADQPKVEKLDFDSQGKTYASLKAIGRSVKRLVLTTVNFSFVNTLSYSVTTEIEDSKPPLITSGPQESIPGNNSITIIWKTDEYATSLVEYGLTPQYGQVARDLTLTTDHKIVLSGLAADTAYHYRVGSVDARDNGPSYSADFSFTTVTPTGQSIVTLAQSHAYGYLGRSLAVGSDQTIHFLYHEKSGEERFIYHQKSSDHGATWSAPVVVDRTCLSGGMPSVAVDSLLRLHVCWHAKATVNGAYGIYYSRSDDGGSTWSPSQRISPAAADHDQLYSAIALDRQHNPHIVWNSALYSDYFEGDVYHAWSQDQGQTWQPGSQISQSAFHRCFVPTIDFDSKGRCHVTYSDGLFDDQSRNAYYQWSEDGSHWNAPVRISSSGVLYDGMIAMVVDAADQVHIAYADNYTPGDIRIMYTSVRSAEVAPPQSVAASSLGIEGHAFHPSLSRDDRGVIYLLYCDAPATAGLNKLNRAREEDIDPFRWNRLLATGAGDIYLSLNRKGVWLPGANVTSDGVDSQNPEMPNRQSGSEAVHLLWMNVQNEAAHVVRYARLNTRSVPSAPPRIVNRSPQADAVEVPYFSVHRLFADFDQRIVSDSLIPENVILAGEKSGILSAELTYLEDQKRLLISPVYDFQPEERVTVRLRNHITNEAGLGLDGNGNGTDDGSPEDDVEWRFTTQSRDTTAPFLAIGLLQHPVLNRYLSVYVKSRERLAFAPMVQIGEEQIVMSLLNAATFLYKGDYKLSSGGTMQLSATGTDLAGNEGRTERGFAAALLTVAQGGVLHSTDGRVQLHIPAGTLAEDAYASIVRIEPGDLMDANFSGETDRCYSILPEQMNGRIVFTQAADGSGSPVIQRRDADGRWMDLATVQEGDRLSASTPRMGVFRVTLSEQMPDQYQLSQNYPNPFSAGNSETSFQIQLPQRQFTELAIYNLLGEKVHTLIRGALNPGVHRFTWNGRDASGTPLAAGLYFYRFSSGKCLLTKKMIILR